MADMSWEHAAEARAALNAIVTDPEHGVAALSSAQTMSNLLKDLLPDAPREKSMLVAAAEAGLASSLREHVAQGMDPNTAIRLTASSFSASTPFTPEACNWVAGEIAIALGISTPAEAGAAGGLGAGPLSGGPPGFDQIGQGGAGATAWAGNQAGYGSPPQPGTPAGYGTPGEAGAPTQMPGYAPGQQQGYQQQAGGYPQAPQTFPQAPTQAAPGTGQAYPGYQQQQQAGAGTGYQGGGGYQASGGGYQGGAGYGGGTGAPPTGQSPWPGGGYGPAGNIPSIPGGTRPARGSRRGLLIAGSLVIVIVIVIVVVASVLGGSKSPNANGSSSPPVTPTTPPPTTPASTPPTTPAGSVEPLSTIMNPPGLTPVGTQCTQAILNGLKASTLIGRTFCSHTTVSSVTVWGYQFDNYSDYIAGFRHLNNFAGFSASGASSTCPPAGGAQSGSVGWHANSNPKYKQRPGQTLECFFNHRKSGTYPALIWTMPTQHVVFIGRDNVAGASMPRLVNWWKTLNYG